MYNVVIFPYDNTVEDILRFIDADTYSVKGIVSPRGWGYYENKIRVGQKELKVCSAFEQIQEDLDCVCFVNSRYGLDFEKYILPVLIECKNKNLDVILCRSFSEEELELAKEYISEDKLHIICEKYLESTLQDEIYDINVPVIYITDMLAAMDSQQVQLEIYKELERRGYRVTLISSKKEMRLVNAVDCIPETVTDDKGYNREKILKFNHYVKQIEITEQPDLIMIGVPGNLLEISKAVTGDFGSGAYIISRSVSPDYVICNIPYFYDFSERYVDVERFIEGRLEAEADAYNMTPQHLDLAEAEESGIIEYMEVSKEIVMNQMGKNEKIYCLQEPAEIVRIVDNMIKKLEGYAQIELI